MAAHISEIFKDFDHLIYTKYVSPELIVIFNLLSLFTYIVVSVFDCSIFINNEPMLNILPLKYPSLSYINNGLIINDIVMSSPQYCF